MTTKLEDDLKPRYLEWLSRGNDRFEPDDVLDGIEILDDIAKELGWVR